jgi:hypothetical protein
LDDYDTFSSSDNSNYAPEKKTPLNFLEKNDQKIYFGTSLVKDDVL